VAGKSQFFLDPCLGPCVFEITDLYSCLLNPPSYATANR